MTDYLLKQLANLVVLAQENPFTTLVVVGLVVAAVYVVSKVVGKYVYY